MSYVTKSRRQWRAPPWKNSWIGVWNLCGCLLSMIHPCSWSGPVRANWWAAIWSRTPPGGTGWGSMCGLLYGSLEMDLSCPKEWFSQSTDRLGTTSTCLIRLLLHCLCLINSMKSFLNLYILKGICSSKFPCLFFTGNLVNARTPKNITFVNKFYLTNIKIVDWQKEIPFLFFREHICKIKTKKLKITLCQHQVVYLFYKNFLI